MHIFETLIKGRCTFLRPSYNCDAHFLRCSYKGHAIFYGLYKITVHIVEVRAMGGTVHEGKEIINYYKKLCPETMPTFFNNGASWCKQTFSLFIRSLDICDTCIIPNMYFHYTYFFCFGTRICIGHGV